MTIYLDIIFFENLFMNFIILYACEIITKSSIKITRTMASSTIGSIYAIIQYMYYMKIFSNFFLKIVLSFVMVYVVFTPKNLETFFKKIVVFYLTSFTFGGVAFAFLYFINPQEILMQKRSFNRYISNKNYFIWWDCCFYFNYICI